MWLDYFANISLYWNYLLCFITYFVFIYTYFPVHSRSFLQDRLDRSFLQDLDMREQKQQRGKGEVNSIKYKITISLSIFFFYSRDQCTRKERKVIHTHVGLWKSQSKESIILTFNTNKISKLNVWYFTWILPSTLRRTELGFTIISSLLLLTFIVHILSARCSAKQLIFNGNDL